MFQDAATQLNDSGCIAELANPAKRFYERVSLFDGLFVSKANKRVGQGCAPLPTHVGLVETYYSSLSKLVQKGSSTSKKHFFYEKAGNLAAF